MVCCIQFFLFKNIDFCIFTPKTPLVKENYFLTLWNFTYLKDTSFGKKKSCNFEHGLETKNEFEKWPLITFFLCTMSIFYSILFMIVYNCCPVVSTDNVGFSRRKLCSCKFSSLAKLYCQISVTKVSELSNIRIAKVSVTNNLRQRNSVRGKQAYSSTIIIYM